MNKIFIAGGSGLLGYNSVKYLNKKNYKISSTFYENFYYQEKNVDYFKLNLVSEYETSNLIERIRPNIIFNFAGLTNVEICEENPIAADKLNVGIAKNLSKIAKSQNILFVQMSTDHLFDKNDCSFTESDKTKPLNVYSETKLKAEECVSENNENSLIIRSNFFCGSSVFKKSFIDIIKLNLKNNKNIELFKNVTFTPISFFLLLDYILLLLKKNKSGIYNVSSNETITKYDFGILLAKYFDFDIKLIRPILLEEKKLVQRPQNMSLDNSKLKSELNINIPSIEDQFTIFFKNHNYGNI